MERAVKTDLRRDIFSIAKSNSLDRAFIRQNVVLFTRWQLFSKAKFFVT